MIHNNYTGNRCGVAWKLPLVVSALLLLASCQRTDNVSDTKSTDREMGGDNPVLVKINNENVTQKDIDFTLLKLLGPSGATKADENARKKVLESLVISRVISQEAQKTMSAESRQNIDQQVAAFREELLVKHYLKEHVEPQPITQEMIRRYYEKHPEKYGANMVREYILLTTKGNPDASMREKLFPLFTSARKEKDWKKLASKWDENGFPVILRSGRQDEELLHKKLNEVIAGLNLSETSKPFIIKGRLYVVRYTKDIEGKEKPFGALGVEIRKELLAEQLNASITKIKESLVKSAKLEYYK